MTPAEFQAWSDEMKAARGRWSVDRVHDGSREDLMLFKPSASDASQGLYITVVRGKVDAGSYEGAVPHLGEAMFRSRWSSDYGSYDAAVKKVVERCGLSVALAVLLGRSPYAGADLDAPPPYGGP